MSVLNDQQEDIAVLLAQADQAIKTDPDYALARFRQFFLDQLGADGGLNSTGQHLRRHKKSPSA